MVIDISSRTVRTAALLTVLPLSSAGCIGDGPVDPETELAAFTLAGGLEVAQALSLRGQEAERLLLPGGTDGAEFVLVPFFGSDSDDGQITLEIEGGELLDVLGPPLGSNGGAADTERFDGRPFPENVDFHRRLREAERRELGPRLGSAAWPRDRSQMQMQRPLAGTRSPPPEVGDLVSLRTINPDESNFCDNPLDRGGRVAAATDNVIMVTDTASPEVLSDAELQDIAIEYDELVEPVAIQNFGAPTDIDHNGRVIVFFTPVVNEHGAGGFMFGGDLFQVSGCAASNEAEIFYILSPDPDGETPITATREVVARLATGIIAHELQHLINVGRRIYVNQATELESVWLDEGLSHIAEELLFYAATPLGPRENITLDRLRSSPELIEAVNRFQVNNLVLYGIYASDPRGDSPISDDVTVATRGASWAFLRYAADHGAAPDSEFFFDLVNSTTSGIANLNAVLEYADAFDLMQAWTASVFSDDEVTGVPAFLTQPSWNYRTLLPALATDGSFPLDVETIEESGTVTVALQSGGAAFLRVRVDPAGLAEFRIRPAGSSQESLRVSVVRAR